MKVASTRRSKLRSLMCPSFHLTSTLQSLDIKIFLYFLKMNFSQIDYDSLIFCVLVYIQYNQFLISYLCTNYSCLYLYFFIFVCLSVF